MSAPHRYDLEPNSCVNKEVKVCNRKLKKYLKVLNNVHILEVDTDREFYTRHGLHMNQAGKEQVAYKIMNTIKTILSEKKSIPIKMVDKDALTKEPEKKEPHHRVRY